MNYVVLGGGVLPDGALPKHVLQRIEYINANVENDDSIIFSALYSLNLPPVIDINGYALSEAFQMKKEFIRVCKKQNIKTYLENSSFDTVGSAYYIRKIFNFVFKDDDLTIVTSDFHIDRAQQIYKKIFDLTPKVSCKSLNFIGLESKFNDISERVSKEQSSIKSFFDEVNLITEIDSFTKWLFAKHDNYTNYNSNTRYIREYGNELKY